MIILLDSHCCDSSYKAFGVHDPTFGIYRTASVKQLSSFAANKSHKEHQGESEYPQVISR